MRQQLGLLTHHVYHQVRPVFAAVYSQPMRRFPPPWTLEALDGGFKIKQTIAYVLAMRISVMLQSPRR